MLTHKRTTIDLFVSKLDPLSLYATLLFSLSLSLSLS